MARFVSTWDLRGHLLASGNMKSFGNIGSIWDDPVSFGGVLGIWDALGAFENNWDYPGEDVRAFENIWNYLKTFDIIFRSFGASRSICENLQAFENIRKDL